MKCDGADRDQLLATLKQLDYEIREFFIVWTLYRQLFDDASNIDILNKSASSVFYAFQVTSCQYFVTFVCRMLDPGKTRQNENLSIQSLVDERYGECFNVSALREEVAALLDSLPIKKIKKHRNKRVAHLDLKASTSPKFVLPVSYDEANEVVDEICRIFNRVSASVEDSTVLFSETIHPVGSDGHTLLHKLRRLIEYEKNSPRSAG